MKHESKGATRGKILVLGARGTVGRSLVEELSRRSQDLIIADRYMPKLNGLELFCSIQMVPLLKDTPFIMITVGDDKTKIEDAQKQGIQHYLVKPFNAETFDNKIQEVLATTQSNH